MAGSYGHVLDEDNENYRGVSLLENMGDMREAVHMMAFMLLAIQHDHPTVQGVVRTHRLPGAQIMRSLQNEYFRCFRGEQPWPVWFRQGHDNDMNN